MKQKKERLIHNKAMRNIFFTLILFIGFFGVNTFSQSEKKPGYGLLIDNTGSLRSQLAVEIETAKEIVKQVGDRGYISIFGFASDPASKSQFASIAAGVECSSDRDLINKQIDNIYTIGGQTTLIDAIKMAADRLDSSKPAKCGEFSERNLILITDGEDRASVTKPKDLFVALKQNGTKVFVVGLISELGTEGGFVGSSPQKKAKDFLENLVKETGGKVVFPKRKQNVADFVKELFEVNSKASK